MELYLQDSSRISNLENYILPPVVLDSGVHKRRKFYLFFLTKGNSGVVVQ